MAGIGLLPVTGFNIVEAERVLSAYAIDESKPAKGYGDNCLWIITERDHFPVARRVLTPALPRAGCFRHGVFYCGHSFKESRTAALRYPVRPAGRG